ncbi:MAG: hypothetical protein NW217_11135 [Hyphomicrobiaceae bacterium]|nr:hypothetical protein [Hyphomicrobiaceae bacterium]
MAMSSGDGVSGDGAATAGSSAKGSPGTGALPADGPAIDGTQRLADCFERSARRWEMIIYPAMIIFTLFAGIAFVQIYRLTTDIRGVAQQVQPQVGEQLVKVSESMQILTHSIQQISHDIRAMHDAIAAMQKHTAVMADQIEHLRSIDANMAQMNHNVGLMTQHTDTMRWNMANMNRSIARPMNFMNSLVPW